MIRLVQLSHPNHGRRIAVVEEPRLRLLTGFASIYELAATVINGRKSLQKLISIDSLGKQLDYDSIYCGESKWRLLPAFDHPLEPARCLVTGTGLTHKKSAENRQAMHAGPGKTPTDSMRMYQWGLKGGRPSPGKIGVAPEWFYKGNGAILRAHGQPLDVPSFGEDGGEEAETAGAYIIDDLGRPRRVGLVQANEFSDHQMERRNYLYLAPSKLRNCSLGPELVIGAKFDDVKGVVRIMRGNELIWSSPLQSGEKNMSHTIANLEHHHFKYAAHRRPGDAHVHFFGADVFSFGKTARLRDGDTMEIQWTGLGRPLRNPLRMDRTSCPHVAVKPI